MLVGINSSQKYRGLNQNFMNGCRFGQTTIVFGRNGSGKTSITEAIRASTLPILIQTPTSLEFEKSSDSQKSKIFVFNRYYVKENLEQFIDASAGAGSISLGSQQIQDKKEKIR